jgi:putative serine protease PepD
MTKSCPQCQTQNRIDAKFCAVCGHRLGAVPRAGGRNLPGGLTLPHLGLLVLVIGGGILMGCVILLLIVAAALWPRLDATTTPAASVTPSATPAPSATATASPAATSVLALATVQANDALERAKQATVFISVPLSSDPNKASYGSGSVVTRRGHILTNNHLFVDDNGKPYNTRGEINVGFPSRDNLKGRVEMRYRAVMVKADTQRDLALIRIVARSDGGALPADLGLLPLPIGDSDRVDMGDQVTVLGYPGLGGASLTLTRGTVSGFVLDQGYIKTDAEINPGNSGGPALNARYEQIGLASAVLVSKTPTVPGKIGWIRPVNSAQSLIDLAKREAGE